MTSLHLDIQDLMDVNSESLKKLPFVSLNTWQVIKENNAISSSWEKVFLLLVLYSPVQKGHKRKTKQANGDN